MIVWAKLLQKDSVVYYVEIVMVILLFFLIILCRFFLSDSNLISVIGIICSVLGSMITAIIIVYFTISKQNFNLIKHIIDKIHPEIQTNIEKLSQFEKQCDDLKKEWLKGNPDGIRGVQSELGRKWLNKDLAESYNPKNLIQYRYRYLKIGNYPIFNDNLKLLELNGIGFNSDLLRHFWEYPQKCHNFCDEIQELESTGNIYSMYIGQLNIEGVENRIFPNIVLINNQYQQLGEVNIAKQDCELVINKINLAMKNRYNIYMDVFNPIFEKADKTSSLTFFDSIFT